MLQAVVQVTDEAWIWCCHGCGVDWQLQLLFNPWPGTSICCRCSPKRKKKRWKILLIFCNKLCWFFSLCSPSSSPILCPSQRVPRLQSDFWGQYPYLTSLVLWPLVGFDQGEETAGNKKAGERGQGVFNSHPSLLFLVVFFVCFCCFQWLQLLAGGSLPDFSSQCQG